MVGARHRRRLPVDGVDQWQLPERRGGARWWGTISASITPTRSSAALATIAASSQQRDYGDILDVMARRCRPSTSTRRRRSVSAGSGTGPSPPITTVQSSGVYTIDPYESSGADGPVSSAGDWYYFEYRQPIGFDASTVTGNPNVRNGVVVHLMDGTDPTVLKSAPVVNPAKGRQVPADLLGQSSTLTLELGSSSLTVSDPSFSSGSVGPGHGLRVVARRQGAVASGR